MLCAVPAYPCQFLLELLGATWNLVPFTLWGWNRAVCSQLGWARDWIDWQRYDVRCNTPTGSPPTIGDCGSGDRLIQFPWVRLSPLVSAALCVEVAQYCISARLVAYGARSVAARLQDHSRFTLRCSAGSPMLGPVVPPFGIGVCADPSHDRASGDTSSRGDR